MSPESYGVLYENHKEWETLDDFLYEYFLDIHKETVTFLGPEFREEVLYFKSIINQLH